MLVEEIYLNFEEKTKIIDKEMLRTYVLFCIDKNDMSIEGEEHHILPRSIFPEYASKIKYPGNIVKLSYSNHLLAHYMLTLSLESLEMLNAFIMMNNFYNKNNIENLEEYSLLKENFRKYLKNSKWSKSMLNKRHMLKDGIFISVDKNEIDSYIEAGYLLKSPSSDTVWKNNGKISIRVSKDNMDYKDWKLGRLETKSKGISTWITKNGKKKRVKFSEMNFFIDDGWIVGAGSDVSTKNYIRINKNNVNKSVTEEDLPTFLSDGWVLGGFKVFCNHCNKTLSSLGKHNHKCKGLEYEYTFYTK